MPQWVELLIVMGAWVVIQTWLRPRLGVPT